VLDGSGEPIIGTDVSIRSGDQTISRTRSGSDGTFSFVADPGRYCVAISAPGFTDFGPSCVNFDSSDVARVAMRAGIIDRIDLPNAAAEPVKDAVVHAKWNFGALVQSGFGVTEDRGGFKFLLIGGHAGRILTPEVGKGLLKGDFEYGVEVFPLWQSYTPKFQRASCVAASDGSSVYCSPQYTVGGTFTGVSVTPIILRWNFTRGERWMPWIQGAGGVVWTNHKYPAFGVPTNSPDNAPIIYPPGDTGDYYLSNDGPNANTSVWNFTPQFGVGTHYFVRPRRSIDVSANAVHISSASLGDKNPGVNASVQFSIGYSWWK
jgi:hypothetical protein